MPNRVNLPTKRLGESLLLGANGNSPFNFVASLGPTETLVSATVTCSVYTGIDPNPQNVISGAAIPLTPQVNQLIIGGVLGTIYYLVCAAVTSLGQTLELAGYLAIVPDVI